MVVIFGDMLELGAYSGFLHRALGAAVKRTGCAMLITYGPLAAQIAKGAWEAGMPRNQIFSFSTGEETAVAAHVLAHAPQDAVILCKGSHAMHMEGITEQMRRFS